MQIAIFETTRSWELPILQEVWHWRVSVKWMRHLSPRIYRPRAALRIHRHREAHLRFTTCSMKISNSGSAPRPQQGREICNFRVPSPLDSLRNLSSGSSSFFSRIFLVRKLPQNLPDGEKKVESYHIYVSSYVDTCAV